MCLRCKNRCHFRLSRAWASRGSGDWSHFGQKAVRTVDTSLPQQFAISLFWIYVSYSGWNAATYVAEEIKQPGKTLAQSPDLRNDFGGGAVCSAEYGFLYAAPLEEMKGVIAIGSLAASNFSDPKSLADLAP